MLKRAVSLRRFFWVPQDMLWLRNKKNIFCYTLFLSTGTWSKALSCGLYENNNIGKSITSSHLDAIGRFWQLVPFESLKTGLTAPFSMSRSITIRSFMQNDIVQSQRRQSLRVNLHFWYETFVDETDSTKTTVINLRSKVPCKPKASIPTTQKWGLINEIERRKIQTT